MPSICRDSSQKHRTTMQTAGIKDAIELAVFRTTLNETVVDRTIRSARIPC